MAQRIQGELAQESHLNSLVYPLRVMWGHWGPERAATSPGSPSWQMARFQNLSSLPASLFFLVPWRVLNSQVCRARGGWAESRAWGLPGRPNSIGETGNKAPGLGAQHFSPALEGGGCTWHRAHIPPRLPLNSSQQGGRQLLPRMLVTKSPPIRP